MDITPDALFKLNEQLRTDASGMQRLWTECGRMCLTRKVSSLLTAISGSTTQDANISPDTRLLNTIAVEANEGLASGLMSWVMPYEGRWFSWKPAPEQDGNEALEEWLAACTEVALTALATSNFYPAAHEALLDRGTFGTATLWAQEGKRNPLMFRCWDAGTFVIGEDEEGYVDTAFREFELTAKQAQERFGDNLPPQVANKLATKPMEKDRYLHAIVPRAESQRSPNGGPQSMPIASIILHKDSKLVVSNSGFEELPAIVTRHLRWSEASAYGASPAMKALAEIRGVNYLELLMSTLAETQVNPRMILPQGYEGTPDLRAGGITMGGLTRDMFPVEWMTQGNLNFGLALIERKEDAVRQAFHAKLFDLFSTRKGDLNIPHVQALQAEQLGRIGPAFTSLTTGFINPILERVFMILYRAGKLPPPPREAFVANAVGQPILLFPRVVQTNRMSQEIQAAKRSRFMEMFQVAASMAQAGRPEVFDNIDGDKATRDIATDSGLRDLLVPLDERERIRQQRAAVQQAQQQREMLMEAAKSPEIVKQVTGALGGAQEAAA